MTPILSPATVEDGPEISAILSDWIRETPWMPRIHTDEEEQGFGAWLVGIMEVTVARVGTDVVGFLACRDGEVHSLYLANPALGRGVGTALLQHAKSNADRLGLWTFQANAGARRFYARHGFVEEKQTDGQGNDEKLPDVYLSWARETT